MVLSIIMENHFLVAGVFDDLYLTHVPYIEKYDSKQSLREAIKKIFLKLSTNHKYPVIDGNAFIEEDTITKFLLERDERYVKWCRIEKYYCMVIACDFYRPFIWSKDCDPELVNWKYESDWYTPPEENPAEHQKAKDFEIQYGVSIEKGNCEEEEPSKNVNVNPVIQLLSQLT